MSVISVILLVSLDTQSTIHISTQFNHKLILGGEIINSDIADIPKTLSDVQFNSGGSEWLCVALGRCPT